MHSFSIVLRTFIVDVVGCRDLLRLVIEHTSGDCVEAWKSLIHRITISIQSSV